MKDLEYKKRALLANEKNIFKKRNSKIKLTHSVESIQTDSIDNVKNQVSKMKSHIQNFGDSTAGGTNESVR